MKYAIIFCFALFMAKIVGKGHIIAFLRRNKKMTRVMLAKLVYRSDDSIRLIELNQRAMTEETLKQFCEIFEIDPRIIINFKANKNE